jgi:hypothetical protein
MERYTNDLDVIVSKGFSFCFCIWINLIDDEKGQLSCLNNYQIVFFFYIVEQWNVYFFFFFIFNFLTTRTINDKQSREKFSSANNRRVTLLNLIFYLCSLVIHSSSNVNPNCLIRNIGLSNDIFTILHLSSYLNNWKWLSL